MGKIKFTQRVPNYFSGVEPLVIETDDFNEIINSDYAKRFTDKDDFYCLAASVDRDEDKYYFNLMSMSKWNEDYNGCTFWWVVGRVDGLLLGQTGLKSW